jgi:uncharacterized protein (DUF433 family)
MQPVLSTHIEIDDRGVARIKGTRFKVRFIAVERTTMGMTPEEIIEQHPGCLTLGQVHAALSYYYDNQAAVDAEIVESEAEAERLYEELRDPVREQALRERMRKLKQGQAQT